MKKISSIFIALSHWGNLKHHTVSGFSTQIILPRLSPLCFLSKHLRTLNTHSSSFLLNTQIHSYSVEPHAFSLTARLSVYVPNMKNKDFGPGNPLGMCEKLFNAFNITPVVRRSLTFREHQDPLLAGVASKVEVAPAVNQQEEIAITNVEKVANMATPAMPPPPIARRNSRRPSKKTENTMPALATPEKDINYKVEDYINRTKNKFMG